MVVRLDCGTNYETIYKHFSNGLKLYVIPKKRKIKTGLYRHVNALTYVCIFTVASIITIAAAVNRTDDIIHIDESQAMVNESVAFNNKDAQKVAAGKSTTETVTEDNAQTQEETTEAQTEAATTEVATESVPATQVKVIADTLNVRDQANEDAEVLGMVDQDEVFEVISQQGDWVEINYNGNNGFVKSEYVENVNNVQ